MTSVSAPCSATMGRVQGWHCSPSMAIPSTTPLSAAGLLLLAFGATFMVSAGVVVRRGTATN